jgi:hypothetical protein
VRIELARIVADWLAAQLPADLAAVPRETPAPAMPTVFDDTRNGLVARGEEPAALPAICVSVEGLTYEGEVKTANTRFADARVLVRYVTADSAATEDILIQASDMTRCILRSISRLRGPANEASRVRNAVQLGALSAIEDSGIYAKAENKTISVSLTLTFTMCRDTAAS